jgi:pyruvate/2-oxoglutarate dehydrogenase complex dihydrolipoamide dehydrogenase (E3) component
MSQATVTYKPSDEVDFVIIGSGAAGGVLAKELSTNGSASSFSSKARISRKKTSLTTKRKSSRKIC